MSCFLKEFRRQVSWEKSYLRPSSSRTLEMDMAKIYNINVTNTIGGGASSCLPCPKVAKYSLSYYYILECN